MTLTQIYMLIVVPVLLALIIIGGISRDRKAARWDAALKHLETCRRAIAQEDQP